MTEIDSEQIPSSTMPPGVVCTVRDFASEEVARRLGQAVLAWVQLVGSFVDIGTLDGITIAIDYDAALRDIDRGLEGLRPLSRSDTEEMQGIAMSPAVMRDGNVLTHIVLNAAPLVPLIADEADEEDRALAVSVIAHECAHVQVTAEKERLIPEARLGTPIEGYERAVMFKVAEVMWDEYAACRLSAPFARNQNVTFNTTLIGTLKNARERADAAITSYRLHADIDRLLSEAGGILCAPMKAASYLFGGMDAVQAGWDDFQDARAAIEMAGFGELMDRLHQTLGDLWNTREFWTPTLQTFAPLEEIAKAVLSSGGIYFATSDDGNCRVEVPFTTSTMPSGASVLRAILGE